MRDIIKFVALLTVLAWGRASVAAGPVTAIKADRIDTITNGVIENGVILIRDTKISEIGTDVEIPANATIIDAGDKTVFPGLVSPVATIGLSPPPGGGPASHPNYRIVDELYPHQHDYKRALQAGFTTLALVPGGTGIGGQGAVVRPVGESPEEMIVAKAGLLWIGFRADDKTKGTIKRAFESARNKKDSSEPDVLPLARALKGEIPTFASCARPADTIHLLDLLEDYDEMKLILVTGTENYRIADRLAKREMPVVVRATIDFELFTRKRLNVPNMLVQAGVKIACTPASTGIEDHEDFRRQMAELVKCGLDAEVAKKAMTIHPAKALGLDYRLGSLEKGKDANLLILDGDVLDATTTVHSVMIEGKIAYENLWGDTQ
jgi:imidazolonepropionase-like amidohydrolase